MDAVKTEHLSKHFGNVKALDDISFDVENGEIFGFLGPNGAGKSTTMMTLTTLLKPTSGSAFVAGYNVVTQAKKVREHIGFVQQETTVDEYLTGRENLLLQARLNHIPKSQINSRIDEVLDLIELAERQNDAVIGYSGGMRKRLDIAGGLLHRPKVLFLDEPTVGLDIQTRRKIWDYIGKIHKEFDMSIFLSTHYMEEADSLCDRVGIIDYGKIQVIDTPQNMKDDLKNETLTLKIKETSQKDDFISKIKEIEFVQDLSIKIDQITIAVSQGTKVIPKIFQIASTLGIEINSISLAQPTLDDVFISYTGHELRDGQETYNRRREHARMKRIRA